MALAAFYPVAGVGLWMLTSWGPVIWLICAATEAVMYGAFPDLFGARWALLASHLVVALLLVGLRVAIMIEEASRPRLISVDWTGEARSGRRAVPPRSKGYRVPIVNGRRSAHASLRCSQTVSLGFHEISARRRPLPETAIS